jgi:hypothetical protein
VPDQSQLLHTTDDALKSRSDLDEDARDVARRKMKTKAFARSRDERKRVEIQFAHLKTRHGFERMRLRGLSGARDEFHFAAIAQNLKTSLAVARPTAGWNVHASSVSTPKSQ